jgi:hypothetical protein
MPLPDLNVNGYLAGKNATMTLNGVTMAVESGTVNKNIGTDEVTNVLSGGYYEDVATIKQCRVTGMRVVYRGVAPPDFEEGDLVAVSITIPNGPSLTWTFRVGSMDIPMVDVKAAVHMGFDLTSQGVYTWTWGGIAA